MVVIVFGLPGSGKSFFAQHLAGALDIAHLKSDDVRDTIHKRGDYDPQSKAVVYETLIEKALKELKAHRAVIVDATFHQKWMREIAEKQTHEHSQPLSFIQITADEATIKARVSKKRPDSDADFTVYENLKATADPLETSHLLLSSSQESLSLMLDQAYAFLNLKSA